MSKIDKEDPIVKRVLGLIVVALAVLVGVAIIKERMDQLEKPVRSVEEAA